MRLLRTLLLSLALAITLAGLVAGLAFVPAVQTWLVERALARHPDLHVSVGSVSAGLSRVRVTQLRLRHDSVGLILPALDATLPVKSALWDRHAQVRSVVAKGWTLDLSGQPPPSEKSPRTSVLASPAAPGRATAALPPETDLAQTVAREFRGLLRGRSFPCDLSIDGLDLEGDVILPPLAGQEPARVHVILQGGGVAPGRSGEFNVDVSRPATDSPKPADTISLRGRLTVTMNSPRTVNRLAFTGQLTAAAGAVPEPWDLSAQLVADGPTANGETYSLDLRRGTRRLIGLTAGLLGDQHLIQGTWKLDLLDSDVARLFPGRALPGLATTGEGTFDTDPAFARVHAIGRTQTALSRLDYLAPALNRLGPASLETAFDLVRTGPSLHVDRLSVALIGARPIAVAHSVQPFACDLRTGELKAADPSADWLQGSLQGFPLAWLSGLVADTVFAGGAATGDFSVASSGEKFVVRSPAPLVATGVSVQRSGRTLAHNLDLSLALRAEHTPAGWQFQATPLVVGSAGRRLATVEAKVSPLAEPRLRQAITGKWDADLDAWAAQPAFAGIGPILGRSATGDFNLRIGLTTEVNSTIKLLGHTADRSVTAALRGYFDSYGGVAFKVPLTVTFGTNQTSVTADGQWTREKTGRRLEVEVSGVDVDLAHLSLLAKSLAAFRGVTFPALSNVGPAAPISSVAPRDLRPFWGDWLGRVKLNFYRLQSGTDELTEVAGTVSLDRGALRLAGGRAVLAPPRLAPARINRPSTTKAEPPCNRLSAEGTLSFDAAAEFPYRVTATAAVDVVDSARLFTADQAAHDPAIEGRFSLVDTLTSHGANLQHLVDRRREEFRLASKSGIVRLLKSDVAPSIPDNATPVKDTLTKVGSVVGALFGIRREAIDSPLTHLSKATQAVLDFSYQTPEIRYDDLTITATRAADRTIHLTEIAITAPSEHLTGSGEIGYIQDRPLRAQPLALDLKFGAKGRIAQLLTTAGLLSADKDEQGYTLLPQPIHFGGTLEQIDNSAWRDLLVKAATETPDRPKKGG